MKMTTKETPMINGKITQNIEAFSVDTNNMLYGKLSYTHLNSIASNLKREFNELSFPLILDIPMDKEEHHQERNEIIDKFIDEYQDLFLDYQKTLCDFIQKQEEYHVKHAVILKEIKQAEYAKEISFQEKSYYENMILEIYSLYERERYNFIHNHTELRDKCFAIIHLLENTNTINKRMELLAETLLTKTPFDTQCSKKE